MSCTRLPRFMLPPVAESAVSICVAMVSIDSEILVIEAEKVGRFCSTAAKAALVCSQTALTVCAAW